MPTENRSSNTEMVSDLLPCPFCGEKPQITKHHREDIYSFMHRCQVLGPISWGFREDQQAHIEKWNARAQPDIQPHPEPIAWMVGTAIWWTKKEAERDAAATGLPVTPVGPITESSKPAEQHQGEPVAWLNTATGNVTTSPIVVMDWDDEKEHVQSLYTHADPAEVERLLSERKRMDAALVSCSNERDELRKANTEFEDQVASDFKFIDDLRAQLAEAHTLLREAACHATRMEPMSASCLNRIDTALDRKD